jgi:dipeptidyl aminopeptidase/acylaminoacyl peptidase
MDLAEELAFSGIVALVFYYQGAWGSSGAYRFTKLETGARDAVSYIRGLPCVDRDRVGLVSHSMGAIPLLKTMSGDTTIKTGALISPVTDISPWATNGNASNVITHFIESARGKLEGMTPEQLRVDLKDTLQTSNPIDTVQQAKAPLLVVVGSSDNVTLPELVRMLYEKAREPKKWVLIDKADHVFSEHRIPLIRAVLDWLLSTL